ncbi:alginate O-acetyltransferase AlgF [Ectopseudomonas chengduensis]|jgi:alginate O-acetyltransferase complex protein AlgF|nr:MULTISPECIES: alginate O-acetyltransferase AlgF [Pseudomonas]KJU76538.1 alginate O-acetyltransferase [Pseudomonas oleovorans]KJU76546.1 alginate O-acetyltransferase [Pseudomonas oleovorans]KQO43911.1 alginate O-acetyltransferase [Pseudomonas sp. Leaf83]MDH1559945.1 alginate O-acetyltransferase AlgF [Pseudomonas chengduensis]UZT79518.1 alginate O-acetyltransferase AlgF [Pseudomonas chengduensis]
MNNTQTTLRRFTLGACALALGLGMLQAQADDGALYGPKAPKGSAFVRAYNASSAELDVSVGQTQLKQISPLGSSDFKFLPAGSYQAQVGNAQMAVDLQAARYYTLVSQTGAEPRLVEEPPFTSRQKALLRVQNLTDSTLSLKTADGKTAVVADVKPDGRGDREINPVKVGLALFEGERKVADLKPVTLERGEVVSLFVTGGQGKLSPVWVKRPIDG